MIRYARVEDGIVQEILELPKEFVLKDVFSPEVAAMMVKAPARVQEGWKYDGKAFSE